MFTVAPALAAGPPEAPSPGPVSAVTATKTTFEGVVNPGTLAEPPQSGTYEFVYKAVANGAGCEGEGKGSQGLVLGMGPEPVPAEPISGLKPGSEYAVCLRVENAAKQATVSAPVTFTTVPTPKNEAPNPLGTTTATFHGKLTPPGSGAEYVFFYNRGDTPACLNEFQSAGSTAEPVEIVSPALEPKQQYTVCLYVYNASGAAEEASPPEHFETKPAPPAFEGESVPLLKATEATLNAVVNPNNEPTKYRFEYSKSATGETLNAPVTTVAGAPPASELENYGGQGVTVSTGAVLAPNTTYYYRGVAENAQSKTEGKPQDGAVKSFTTTTPSGEEASAITGTTATLKGALNPVKAGEADSYEFIYKVSPTECEGETATGSTSAHGGEGEAVKIELTSLSPHTTYTFCLKQYNILNEAAVGAPVTFTTSAAGVSVGSAAEVGATSTKLTAQVDPGGAATSCYVEYGPSEAYGSSTPAASAGAESAYVGVQATLEGLQSDTLYHYRFVAKSSFGTTPGPDATFTTFPPSVSALPDNRAYELVSVFPQGADTEVYVPNLDGAIIDQEEDGTKTNHPFRVSPDGEAVIFPGDPPPTGASGKRGFGSGNEYMATRTSKGWETADMHALGTNGASEYRAFSSDLSVGILAASENELGGGTEKYNDLYAHATAGGVGGAYGPFYTGTPPNQILPNEFNLQAAGGNTGTSTVPAFSHLLFEADDALGTLNVPAAGGSGEDPSSHLLFREEQNLYDSTGGGLYLVNVLPEGETEANASFGFGSPKRGSHGGGSHLISANGSRIFWTALEGPPGARIPKALYVRENDASPDASTVLVADGGEFLAANSEGSLAFYTKKGDLYSFDVETGQTTDLSVDLIPGEEPEVQGVVATSEDGGYFYFAADGVLTTGENAEGKAPIPGQPNLYLSHDDATTFIAALSPNDGSGAEPFSTGCSGGGGSTCIGDWQTAGGYRTAEVTPDGHSLVFMSVRPLTGYDPGTQRGGEGEPLQEVFLYQAPSGKLTCVSCNPSGEPPIPTELTTHYRGVQIGGFTPITASAADEQQQVISEDGDRVFFDSGEPLLPTATNGWINVYEWERAGTPDGSCPEGAPGGGCTYLLSSGAAPENSYLLGADSSGANAFFISRAQLVAQDRGSDDYEVYDARVDGAQAPPAAACEGTGCQGVPPTPPIFATPSSVTFNGIGNLSPPLSSSPLKKTTKAVKCKKPKKRNKHNQCVKVKTKRRKAKKASRATNDRRAK